MIYIKDIINIIGFSLFVAIILNYLIIQPLIIIDDSMKPYFKTGDVILINRIPYWLDEYKRGDLLALRGDIKIKTRFVSRIVGLPFESISIKEGSISIMGSNNYFKELAIKDNFYNHEFSIKLDENEFFVMSDNQSVSATGRIDKRFIIGKPYIRIWPINNIRVY